MARRFLETLVIPRGRGGFQEALVIPRGRGGFQEASVIPRGRGGFQPGHTPQAITGVLLVNLGTPEAPTPRAIRRYLREFLWDPRMVELPRWIWWLVLNLLILPLRAKRVAQAYGQVWRHGQGSPLKVHSMALAVALARHFAGEAVCVEMAMRYGHPSVAQGLARLREAGVGRLVVLPLYPQYASASTATVYDAVGAALRGWRYVPPVTLLGDYHAHPAYIAAIAAGIAAHRAAHGDSGHLLLSFHGLPDVSRRQGDPYHDQCLRSAGLIAEALGLQSAQWSIAFQSRFGRAEWLKPYCVDVLKELPQRGVRAVDVVCPGFAVDCLETLQEMAEENRRVFLAAGGEAYHYIPALNESPAHVALLATLLKPYLV
ncbi:MAG: ferrochelatase [Methylococcaceae bacterium]|nr:MAG: ferrochelatase [Methylococcaceae bacterium]